MGLRGAGAGATGATTGAGSGRAGGPLQAASPARYTDGAIKIAQGSRNMRVGEHRPRADCKRVDEAMFRVEDRRSMNQEQILTLWKSAAERGLQIEKNAMTVGDGVTCSFTVQLGQNASSIADVKRAELVGDVLVVEGRDHAFTYLPQGALLALVVKPPRANGDRTRTGF